MESYASNFLDNPMFESQLSGPITYKDPLLGNETDSSWKTWLVVAVIILIVIVIAVVLYFVNKKYKQSKKTTDDNAVQKAKIVAANRFSFDPNSLLTFKQTGISFSESLDKANSMRWRIVTKDEIEEAMAVGFQNCVPMYAADGNAYIVDDIGACGLSRTGVYTSPTLRSDGFYYVTNQ